METMNQASLLMASANSIEEQEAALFRSLPSGYRFKPRDEELVEIYLKRKIQNRELPPNIIRDVDLYNYDPDTLTAMNNNGSSNEVVTEWFFFTPRDRKYANGSRPRRCAGDGYWKASGKDKEVFLKKEKIGLKKTLVYYRGKPPKGDKTDWTMHEYVLNKAPVRQRHGKDDMRLDDWVLCRVYKRLAKSRRSSGKDADVVHSEVRVVENGNPPLADSSNMSMSNMFTRYSKPFYPMAGHNPDIVMPLSCVGPSDWSHLPPMQQQQQFSNVYSSNQLQFSSMQQQQFSDVGPSNQPHFPQMQWLQFSDVGPSNQQQLPQMQQQQFSNVGPSNQQHLPQMQQQQFSNVGPSNQLHLPPKPQQLFSNVSYVGPSNPSHLPPKQQQQFSTVAPSNQPHSLPKKQQSSNVGPSNQPHLPLMQQQQFSNVGPSNRSHLSPIQQQPFDALPEQNSVISSNLIPTHIPLQPWPPNQQSCSQAPPQQPFSHVGPSNPPHLPPPTQQQPRQQEEVSGDKAIDYDSIIDDTLFEDFSSTELQCLLYDL